MLIRLTQDEIVQAIALYAEKKLDYKVSEAQITESGFFIIEDESDKKIAYSSVEFEFDAGDNP